MLWKKKEGVPEEINMSQQEPEKEKSPETGNKADTTPPAATVPAKPERPGVDDMLSSRMEKLEMEIQAFNDLKSMYDQRFLQITEKIGELRSNLIEKERKINEISSESEKASDIVKTVKPEQLYSEVKKEGTKIDAITTRIEADKSIVDKMKADLGELREDVFKFRGLEEAVELSKDLLKKITEINKIRSVIEIDSSRVAKMFLEMEKNFAEIENFKEMVKQISDAQTEVSKQMNDIAILKNTFARKGDLKKFYDLVDEKLALVKEISSVDSNTLKKFVGTMGEITRNFDEMKKKVDDKDSVSRSLADLGKKITSIEKHISGIESKNQEDSMHMESLKLSLSVLEERLRKIRSEGGDMPVKTISHTKKKPKDRSRFGALNEAISSGDVYEAQGEYKKLYDFYGKMSPKNPKCGLFYKKLMDAFKKINEM
jgi:chromosome segregation ATPase